MHRVGADADWTVSNSLFNLHTRSMWETICDTRASRVWHGKIYAHLSSHYPRIPPSPPKLKFDQNLALWALTTQECVETNRCIPQGYHLVLPVAEVHSSVGLNCSEKLYLLCFRYYGRYVRLAQILKHQWSPFLVFVPERKKLHHALSLIFQVIITPNLMDCVIAKLMWLFSQHMIPNRP